MDLHMGGRAEPALPGTKRPAVTIPAVTLNAMPPATPTPNASQERQLQPGWLHRRIPPKLNELSSTQTPAEDERGTGTSALRDAGVTSNPETRRRKTTGP